jgi:CMP-N,N'-diacetyllegionaminic acid synthase
MIVVVPARGGSKGLPGKNLRLLAGVPLIVHTLRTALLCESVERVIVSTDDDEIIRVSRDVPGVEVPFRRPPHLATDDASAVDAYLHVADSLGITDGEVPRDMCVLLPTAPLREPLDVDSAIALYRSAHAEVVFSVTETKPVAWCQHMDACGRLNPAIGKSAGIGNRQEFHTTWVPNGSIYVFDIEVLRRSRTYFGPETYGYPMPAARSVDIDTEADFVAAEALYHHNLQAADGSHSILRRAV